MKIQISVSKSEEPNRKWRTAVFKTVAPQMIVALKAAGFKSAKLGPDGSNIVLTEQLKDRDWSLYISTTKNAKVPVFTLEGEADSGRLTTYKFTNVKELQSILARAFKSKAKE